MGLSVQYEDFAALVGRLHREGASRIEWDRDGSVACIEFHREHDTIPAPRWLGASLGDADPHPDLFPADELPSEKIARELGWLEQWSSA